MSDGTTEIFDTGLLDILVCPVTRGPLEYDAEAGELVSKAAGVAYPVKQGVPVMLIEEARKL
ncbi:Trm112 family protein [Parasphingorhabdus sp.]|uniref:Trm112 family protein n=1 Tax=Parasphingorhabdus sp. TaxID=2709688 RepID=UPI002F92AFB5